MMRKLLALVIFILFFSCSRNDTTSNCNFLLNVGVNLTVNTNLPEFSQLQFVGNAVRVNGQGNEGIVLIRVNANSILAWDGADPNHTSSACSALAINGFEGSCGCGDNNIYNFLTGQLVSENPQPCTLKPYRVEFIGNNTYLVSN